MSNNPLKIIEDNIPNSPENQKISAHSPPRDNHNISSGFGEDLLNKEEIENEPSCNLPNNINSSGSVVNSDDNGAVAAGPTATTTDPNTLDDLARHKKQIFDHPLYPVVKMIYKKCHLATNGRLDDIKDGTGSLAKDKDEMLEKLKGVKYDKGNEIDRLVSTLSFDCLFSFCSRAHFATTFATHSPASPR